MAASQEDTFTVLEHLGELRKRMFWVIVVLAAGVVAAAIFNDRVFDLLLYPLRQVPNLDVDSYQIITLSPTEPFMVSLKVWVVASLLVTSPFLIWQLWAFIGPAFTSTEKRYFYPVVVSTIMLFLGGVVFGYFFVLPKGLSFLLTFGGSTFNVQNRATEYFTFVALFVLAFGVIFELPVVLVMLAKVGVIDDKFLRKNRRYAIVISALVAALLTPGQDAFSMVAMLIPLLVLYEISIPIARLVQPKREPATSAKDVDDIATGTT
ncbi:MAG TPA: twin-arginine translocase subunit TatC [Thermoleophilia bacterium]|nr:twin-arginine translocase subunit TatC [Thermoleophilia bacterium]